MNNSSHRYREVTGSNPVEVRNFFSVFFTQLHKLRSLRRSFLHFHFISAVYEWFISDIIRTKTICQNQRIWLRYTRYSSRSAARVGPQTKVILPLLKRPPKITTLCGNLSVGRRHNNILHRRNDGFANNLIKQCFSWAPGMVRQKFDGTTPRKM